jgi:hypothetical protein
MIWGRSATYSQCGSGHHTVDWSTGRINARFYGDVGLESSLNWRCALFPTRVYSTSSRSKVVPFLKDESYNSICLPRGDK